MNWKIEQALKCVENELAASAAGYPGVWDDATCYVRVDMLLENYLPLAEQILKENGVELEFPEMNDG